MSAHKAAKASGSLPLAILFLCLASSQPCLAAQSSSAVVQEESYTFAFQNAPVAQVAQEVFDAIGVRYSIDPSATGRISFRIDQRLSRSQLLRALEAALAANNIVLVPQGDGMLLTARSSARSSASVRPADEGVRSAGYEVIAVPLSFAVPTEVAKALEAITGPGVILHANDKLGLIVLGGSGQQLQSALQSLRVFDQSGLENSKIRWFELSQAPALQVASELEALLRASGAAGIRVAPLKRLNGIILFGNTNAALDQISAWVPRLDAPTKDSAASLWVYHPRNTSAEALARTLNSVVAPQVQIEAGASAGSSAVRQFDSVDRQLPAAATVSVAASEEPVRAAVDKDTNTLLVSAPAWRWTQLQRILNEIDRPQAQLLVEATILEVTLRDDFRLGVDWAVLGASGKLNISNVGNQSGDIGPTYPGFSITFLDNSVQAAITALGSKTNVEVLSAPKIVTLDNRTAHLQVGDQVPIVTQTSRSTAANDSPVINTIDYRNSGVILTVTPRISGEDRIILEIAQEVSTVVKTQTSGIDSPTIQQRKLESTLALTNGGVVALGGLINRSRSLGDSGIPWFKDIPGLGGLFRTSTRGDDRTELIVLLSAKIIKDPAAAERTTTELLSDLREIQARGLLNDR